MTWSDVERCVRCLMNVDASTASCNIFILAIQGEFNDGKSISHVDNHPCDESLYNSSDNVIKIRVVWNLHIELGSIFHTFYLWKTSLIRKKSFKFFITWVILSILNSEKGKTHTRTKANKKKQGRVRERKSREKRANAPLYIYIYYIYTVQSVTLHQNNFVFSYNGAADKKKKHNVFFCPQGPFCLTRRRLSVK